MVYLSRIGRSLSFGRQAHREYPSHPPTRHRPHHSDTTSQHQRQAAMPPRPPPPAAALLATLARSTTSSSSLAQAGRRRSLHVGGISLRTTTRALRTHGGGGGGGGKNGSGIGEAAASSQGGGQASDMPLVTELLRQVRQGTLPVETAAKALVLVQGKGFDAVDGYAKIDYAREARTGLPEVIYGEGKTPEQLLGILQSMGRRRTAEEAAEDIERRGEGGAASAKHATTSNTKSPSQTRKATKNNNSNSTHSSSHSSVSGSGIIVASRVSPEKYAALRSLMEKEGEGGKQQLESFGHLEYLPTPRLLILRERPGHRHIHPNLGTIAVLCAGTADLSVAEEAATIAELCGAKVHRLYDVGIAGIHRLFASLDTVRKAHACIAVAGMDGALPTVVAGLVPAPVIAIPTAVGYGIGANGIAPLMTMLNACAPGVAVVNIDNGIGGAAMAVKILRGRLRK